MPTNGVADLGNVRADDWQSTGRSQHHVKQVFLALGSLLMLIINPKLFLASHSWVYWDKHPILVCGEGRALFREKGVVNNRPISH